MERLSISCQSRQVKGKGAARKLRREGFVPGVLYGGDEVLPVALDPKDIKMILSSGAGENAIFQLILAGEKGSDRNVILRELQYDTVKGHLLHADLFEISMDEELEVDVPIELVGTPAGADEGGILTHPVIEVRVKCLPDRIPDKFVLDVSALEIGHSLHISDLTVPAGVTVLDEMETTVVNVTPPRVEEVVVVEEEELEEEVAAEEAAPEEEAKEATKEGTESE
jgi:large subunit ribosomal protein L25